MLHNLKCAKPRRERAATDSGLGLQQEEGLWVKRAIVSARAVLLAAAMSTNIRGGGSLCPNPTRSFLTATRPDPRRRSS